MNPLIIPLIKGAVEIFKSRQAFKENLKSKTTVGAGVAASAGVALQVAQPDNEYAAIMYIIAGVLFLWRKYKG